MGHNLIRSNGTGGGPISAPSTWVNGVAPISGDIVLIIAGDVIETNGINIMGSGLSPEESNKLLALPTKEQQAQATWDHII